MNLDDWAIDKIEARTRAQKAFLQRRAYTKVLDKEINGYEKYVLHKLRSHGISDFMLKREYVADLSGNEYANYAVDLAIVGPEQENQE